MYKFVVVKRQLSDVKSPGEFLCGLITVTSERKYRFNLLNISVVAVAWRDRMD